VLADLDEAERSVAADATPRGRVRVNSSVPFGLHFLLPLVPRFTAFPEVQLDVTVTDQVIDLMDERADVAIRVGPMRPSQLMARKLGDSASSGGLARLPGPARDAAGHPGRPGRATT
jgi:DNA-binding transcriptional LysR family regulator